MAAKTRTVAVPAKPRLSYDEAKERLRAAVADSARKTAALESLPEVIGEYRALDGQPGVYLKPMKARQQIQAAALFAEIIADEGQTSAQSMLTRYVHLAALVTYRVALPDEPEAAYADIAAHIRGESNIFTPATADELLDLMTMEDIRAKILNPMGLSGESQSPNA